MTKWRLICGIAAGVLALGGTATACRPDNGTTSGAGSTTATVGGEPTTGADTAPEKKSLPNFVGKGLQSAQDAAQADGFYNLDSHDASGRDRNQILDRDWKVCSQNVKAGSSTSTDTRLDFGTVKLEETCPAEDQSAPGEAGATMPDFEGNSVKAARSSLDSNTSITVKDATGDDRLILVESNWKVCTQHPRPGSRLDGQPVTFTAVKYEETCP